MKNFQEKVVWITGASSGIGESLAYAFAKEGAFLVLSARNIEKLKKVRGNCLKITSKCWIFPIDLLEVSELEKTVTEVINQTVQIDVLINNAGRSQRSLGITTPIQIDREIMELNFFSVVVLTKLVLKHMINKQSGHLVVVSSITGKFGFPMRTTYCASKHALQGYFESLRTELIEHNIKVTIVSPGRINTDISKNALTENGQSYNKMDAGQANGMAADKCATLIVKAIKNERKDVFVGGKEIIILYIRRLFPALFYKLASKIKN
jgi:short-subunit dehydrogenase